MKGYVRLVFSCNNYQEYCKKVIENYSIDFSNIKVCFKCKTKSPKCWRHYYIYYNIEIDKSILVIIFKCCNATKVILPSYLIQKKGIGSDTRVKIFKALSNPKMLQKDIAKKFGVSEATVTRLKQKYLTIRPERVVSEIIQADSEYPTSSLINNDPDNLPESGHNLDYTYKLLAIYKTARLKKGYCNQQVPLYLQQMCCLLYYDFQKENIKIIAINKIE